MKKLIAFILPVLLWAVVGCSDNSPERNLTFAFYNVENLFDTVNDPHTNDDAFLPDSQLQWNTEKYQHKLENLAKVIRSMNKGKLPSVLGLSEVENRAVVEDLLKMPGLNHSGYELVHAESPDDRGLDDVLLYNPKEFNLKEARYINIGFPGKGLYSSAYVLYAKGLTPSGDTLHVFVNHWISRWKGKEETEVYRMFTAEKLRNVIENIFNMDYKANIIVAGDFNDNPTDPSIVKGLKALKPAKPLQKRSLYNLALIPYEKGEGTVYNNNHWDMFDQIIVSTAMLTGENGLQVTSSRQKIIKYPWMLQKTNGIKIPYRTATNRYLGGYSDHLPVMIEMRVDNAKDVSSII